jgi:KaiC/GvpD/RAD55 family RecA-like ATPase
LLLEDQQERWHLEESVADGETELKLRRVGYQENLCFMELIN